MALNFSCSRCHTVLNAEPEMSGKVAKCPACGTKLRVPKVSQMHEQPEAPNAPATPGTKAKQKAATQGWQNPSSGANMWITLGIALAATVLTLLVLALFKSSFIGQVVYVGTGEWVNYAEIFLFFWGLAIVISKWQQVKRQRSALMLDVLPTSLGHEIMPEHVDAFLDYINNMPHRVRESLMVNRIRKALELFQSRRNNSEVGAMLSTLSDVDANRTSSSYAIVKVFLWAIPILGFIGTVLGLSFAMASFGGADLSDPAVLKSSVTSITSGLAVAFNTTLLGLLLSMVLMFPTSAVQTSEEDCLTEIDAFCNEHLMPRLNDGGQETPAFEFSENPTGFLEELAGKLATQQHKFLESLTQTSGNLTSVLQNLDEKATGQQAALAERIGRMTHETNERARAAVEHSMQMSLKHLNAIEAGINGINAALQNLGEKQIVVQREKKRGLFGRG